MDLNVLILGENVIDDKIAGMKNILMLENMGSIGWLLYNGTHRNSYIKECVKVRALQQ